MKEITRLMINNYKLKDIDFMGYKFDKDNASFHHLIIPKRNGGKEIIQNGAVLNRLTSHPYIHTIEQYDFDLFSYITSEMIDENILGKLDIECLRRINGALKLFEREYSGKYTRKGKPIVKEEYTKRLIL